MGWLNSWLKYMQLEVTGLFEAQGLPYEFRRYPFHASRYLAITFIIQAPTRKYYQYHTC